MIWQGIPILLMETRVNVFRVVILIFLRSNSLLQCSNSSNSSFEAISLIFSLNIYCIYVDFKRRIYKILFKSPFRILACLVLVCDSFVLVLSPLFHKDKESKQQSKSVKVN